MTTPAPSLFESVGQRTEAFSNRPENALLLSLTGSWSALPRGSLFGLNDAREVAAALAHRRVKILFVGANPGMKESPRFKTKGLSDYLASGRYGEIYWDADQRIQPGWNPFFDAGTWKRCYGQWLARVGVLDETAMLNFIPWRSSDLKQFVASLEGDAQLLLRVLQFCDTVHRELVEAMNPALIVVTRSVAEAQCFQHAYAPAFARVAATSIEERRIKFDGENAVNYAFGRARYGATERPVAYLPHPASLRANKTLNALLQDLSDYCAGRLDKQYR